MTPAERPRSTFVGTPGLRRVGFHEKHFPFVSRDLLGAGNAKKQPTRSMRNATMMTVHAANAIAQRSWCGNVRFAVAVVCAARAVSLPITRTDAKRQPSGLERGDPA